MLDKPQRLGGHSPVPRTKRVLFIASVYSHLAAFHIPFIRLLQEWGYEVHTAASPDRRRDEVTNVANTCWDIPFARSPYSLGNVDAYRQLGQLLTSFRYDLIHVHTPTASFIGRYLSKRTQQGAVLYTAHGFHFYSGAPARNWLLYFPAELLAARWTDGLIVMNSEDYDNARRLLRYRPGTSLFRVSGVGVPGSQQGKIRSGSSLRDQLSIASDSIVVTCVAELNRNKNQAFLLAAWEQVASLCSSAHLVLVGDGEEAQELQELVMRRAIRNVHFLGFRSDVDDILAETDIAVLVSRREGLPRSVLEAMMAAKPIVVSNIRGNRDLVEHGANGFSVSVADVASLTSALTLLIGNRSLRESMGRAGAEKVIGYSMDHVLDEMGRIYARYLER